MPGGLLSEARGALHHLMLPDPECRGHLRDTRPSLFLRRFLPVAVEHLTLL